MDAKKIDNISTCGLVEEYNKKRITGVKSTLTYEHKNT